MRKILLTVFLASLAFTNYAAAQTVFRIASLNTTNPNMILGDSITGDDGSAFAVSSSSVFFTGDSQTGRFNLADLGGGAGLPQGNGTRYTTLASDLQTGKIYTLATSASAPINSNGTITATHIIEMNPATGALTGNVFQLSTSILINNGTGFFSGAGRILIDNRASIYELNPATGAVVNLAASSTNVNPYLSESDGRYWGVAEFFGGASYTVYRRAGTHDIVRTRVSDGATSIVQSFPYLGDMSQFSVSPLTQRWYYHSEDGIFFGGSGNQETIGYADAVIELANPNAPIVTVTYANQTVDEDSPTPFVLDTDVHDNFSDPNGDELSFLASSNTPNVSVAIVGNELRLTNLAANFSGTVVISVTATDNRDGSATNSFNLVVGAVNDLPVVTNAQPDRNIFGNSATPLVLDDNLDDNFSDVEGSITLFSATSDNPNVTVETSGTRGAILRLTALGAGYTGTANIIITARDSNGATVSDVFALQIVPPQTAADLFTITTLGTTGSNIIDANGVAGDDGSAFAVGTNAVLYTGDTATGSFSAEDLSGGVRFGARYTTLTSDLRSGRIYSFGTSATQPITDNGSVTATHLLEINQGNGAVISAVQLSQTVNFSQGTGIFAGFRRIVVSNGSAFVYSVDPASGTVVSLGATPAMNAALSESDARFWGVAEFDGANTFLVYRQNSQNIVRTRIGDGATSIVQTFTNLGQITQFSVSLTRNRWYYHSEGGTQFGTGYEEAVGYVDATFNFAAGNNTAPTVSAPLADVSVNEDSATPFVLDDNLTNNFSDSDGDLLAFQAETDNAGVSVAVTNGNRLTVSNLAANFTGAVSVTVSARDGRGGLVSDSLVFTVVPADNDAPVNNLPATQTTLQNRPLYLNGSNRILISDPDAGNNPVQTTLTVTNGTLTLGFVPAGLTATGNNTNAAVLTGTIVDINIALNNLLYNPTPSFSGAEILTVTTNDGGNSGPGTAQIDRDSLTINVVADADFDGVADTQDACPNTPANASVNPYGCAAGQAASAPDGLQLWLTGDGDARDFSGNDVNGTLNNGTNFAVGKVGQAFNFDGINDSISFAVPASVTGSNPRTIEFWYKVTAGEAAANRELFYYGTFNSRKAFGIGIDDTSLSGTGSLRLKFFNSVDNFRFDTGIQPGQFTHLAVTYDGATAIQIFVNGNLNQTFVLPAPLNTTSETGFIGGFGGYFSGQIDEVSLYNRALTQAEIRSVTSVGASGKLKSRPTATGATVQTQITSATISLPSVTAAGATRETPLDGATLPTLPTGSNSNALFVDVSTSAIYAGSPTVCFNVPAFAVQLANAALYHLENGVWVNRAGTRNGTQLCTTALPSLSPFALVPFAPTAASVSLSGRVITPQNLGLTNAFVTLTDSQGNSQTVMTRRFGNYQFNDVAAGETYIISVTSKRYRYAAQVVNVTENLSDLDFTPIE